MVGPVSMARDVMLISYVATFALNGRDPKIKDMEVYRKSQLGFAAKYEAQRAALVGQQPTPIEVLVNQMFSAMKRRPHDYTYGLRIDLPNTLPGI